jgi:GNAT superfamily N-acetyltransferase
MIANYLSDPTLYPRCIELIDDCFPGIKVLAQKGKQYGAHWDRISIPFIISKGGELIAHLGIIPLDLIVNQKATKGAAIHAVCVAQNYRNSGYFKELMDEALAYTKKHFDCTLLFTDQPFLYTKFGFTKVAEQDFMITNFTKTHLKSDLRKIDLNNVDDKKIMDSLLSTRLPVSQRFGIVNETAIFTLFALEEPIYYSQQEELLLAYTIERDTLYLRDIVFTKPCELQKVINLIEPDFSWVLLQFCPDQLGAGDYQLMKAIPECGLMITSDILGEMPFRYPELARC